MLVTVDLRCGICNGLDVWEGLGSNATNTAYLYTAAAKPFHNNTSAYVYRLLVTFNQQFHNLSDKRKRVAGILYNVVVDALQLPMYEVAFGPYILTEFGSHTFNPFINQVIANS